MKPAVVFLGRLLMTYIFATSGLAKILDWSGNVSYMSSRHLPWIPVLLAAAVAIELAGTICLVTGLYARVAAAIMALYLMTVTLIFHAYWTFSGELADVQETHFRLNLAIVGGLLVVPAQGAGK
jgi:putative oxidoreductase